MADEPPEIGELERTADWRLPGPVERHRLLARGPDLPALAGMLGPDTGQGQGLYLPGQHP